MASVFDVAAFILELCSKAHQLPVTTWKLQKLVYYSQAWSLVWDDRVLFPEEIQAWANGPVCPALYARHRGQFKISELPEGNSRRLRKVEKETIEVVVDHYGTKTPQYLSALSHQERPWLDARKGLKPAERGTRGISLDSMAEYYGGLAGGKEG